jgi:cobalt/nickel transport system permease protein
MLASKPRVSANDCLHSRFRCEPTLQGRSEVSNEGVRSSPMFSPAGEAAHARLRLRMASRHTLELDTWAQRDSAIHRVHASVFTASMLVLLVAIALTRANDHGMRAVQTVVVIAGIVAARLPLTGVLRRAMAVLPFALVFAALRWSMGEPQQATALLARSYLSAVAAVFLAGVLGIPRLTRALGSLGTPRLLITVIQFLYRYLLLLGAEAQSMLTAAKCRGLGANREAAFAAATGSVATLFARSYTRAERIHGAMLSRGFVSELRTIHRERLHPAHAMVLLIAVALLALQILQLTGFAWR